MGEINRGTCIIHNADNWLTRSNRARKVSTSQFVSRVLRERYVKMMSRGNFDDAHALNIRARDDIFINREIRLFFIHMFHSYLRHSYFYLLFISVVAFRSNIASRILFPYLRTRPENRIRDLLHACDMFSTFIKQIERATRPTISLLILFAFFRKNDLSIISYVDHRWAYWKKERKERRYFSSVRVSGIYHLAGSSRDRWIARKHRARVFLFRQVREHRAKRRTVV